MTTGMNLWDADVWSFVLTLSLLFAAMIAANILRRLCPFIRKALIPSSVLGGFLLLLANAVPPGGYHHRRFSPARWKFSRITVSVSALPRSRCAIPRRKPTAAPAPVRSTPASRS